MQPHVNMSTSCRHVNISPCLWLIVVTEVSVGIWIRDKFKPKIDRSVNTPWWCGAPATIQFHFYSHSFVSTKRTEARRVNLLYRPYSLGKPSWVIFRHGTQFWADIFVKDKNNVKLFGLFTWAKSLSEDWLFLDCCGINQIGSDLNTSWQGLPWELPIKPLTW